MEPGRQAHEEVDPGKSGGKERIRRKKRFTCGEGVTAGRREGQCFNPTWGILAGCFGNIGRKKSEGRNSKVPGYMTRGKGRKDGSVIRSKVFWEKVAV